MAAEPVVDAAQHPIQQPDQRQKRNEHDAHVEGQAATVNGSAGNRAEQVLLAVFFVDGHRHPAHGGGSVVSGTSILEMSTVPGAVMITAASRCLASIP